MDQQIELNKKFVIDKIKEYNSINKELNRYVLFNDFLVIWKIQDAKVIVDMYPSDEVQEDIENLFDNPLTINLANQHEISWFEVIVNNLITNANKKLAEAKEIARPQNGILIFDSQTNKYFLNSHIANAITKSKNTMKTITWTRLELLGLFINLHYLINKNDYSAEILELEYKDVFAIGHKIVKQMQVNASNERLVQFLPSYEVNLIEKDDNVVIETYVKYFKDEHEEVKIFTRNEKVIKTNNCKDAKLFYNVIRGAQETAQNLLEYKFKLISKQDPPLYYENEQRNFMATEVGKKVYEKLNLLEFLDKDITEIFFEI